MCMTSGLDHLISVTCKMRILMMDVSNFRHAVSEMMKSVCHIWMHHHWAGVVSVCVLLVVPCLKVLYGSLFLSDMDLFSYGFNGCC